MLVRIVAMRTKLVGRFDPYQYRMRENAPSLAGPFEHEDDDEHEDESSTSKFRFNVASRVLPHSLP